MLELITELPITFLNIIHGFVFIVTQERRVTLNLCVTPRVFRFSVELTGNKNICYDTNGPHIGSVWNRVVIDYLRRNKFGCSEIDLKLLMWNVSTGKAEIDQFYMVTIWCHTNNIFFSRIKNSKFPFAKFLKFWKRNCWNRINWAENDSKSVPGFRSRWRIWFLCK